MKERKKIMAHQENNFAVKRIRMRNKKVKRERYRRKIESYFSG
jgi:hypothetical protein